MLTNLILSLAVAGQATPPAATVPVPPPVVTVPAKPAAPAAAKPPIPPAAATAPARPNGAAPASEIAKAAQQAAQVAMFADMFVAAFDRVLPPQADPDPARLALAHTTIQGIWPAGTYDRVAAQMLDKMLLPSYDRLMGMTGDELSTAIGLPITSGKEDGKLTARAMLTKDDPNFDARIHAYLDALRGESHDTMLVMEPKMREGMARALARKFDARQLGEINAFFATPTGQAFGREWILAYMDGDVYRGMVKSLPDLLRAAPAMAKRFEEVDKRYPWPKTPEAKTAPKAKAAPARKK